ncbi:hypothetical protein [Streptomyces geranii]|uniref:hypothetical protein n=1 Tax=Streptomyces geranii TaxID=2058923 RepID=UPI001300820E|nr:hypothetical protein [Streptomyces geranii]
MKRRNVVDARRKFGLVARLTRRANAPTSPEIGAVAPKRRLRRMVGLAVAATLTALPVSVGVQSVTAPKAQAAVNDQYSWITTSAALTLFNYWRNSQQWPSTGTPNSVWDTGSGWANGGGTYNDYDRQLRNWIGNETGNWGTMHFREYDDATRAWPNTGRGAGRYVYNVEYGIIFHTVDHYTNFTPLNFGRLPTPWFPQTVFCYEHPNGQPNNRRIVLHTGHSSPVAYTVSGLPGSGMSVDYRITEEWWHNGDRRYYVDTKIATQTQGLSFNAYNSLRTHGDASQICRNFTRFWYGTT